MQKTGNQADYVKNILKFSSIPPSKIKKEMFLGIVVCTILDETIIRTSDGLRVFVGKIFKGDFTEYLYLSRPFLVLSITQEIYDLDFYELQKVKIRFFNYFDEINLGEKESKCTMRKWLDNKY